MPKLKTRRSVAKRFRLTASGKFRRGRAFRSHLLSGRSRKRKRHLRRKGLVHRVDEERVKALLPYAG